MALHRLKLIILMFRDVTQRNAIEQLRVGGSKPLMPRWRLESFQSLTIITGEQSVNPSEANSTTFKI